LAYAYAYGYQQCDNGDGDEQLDQRETISDFGLRIADFEFRIADFEFFSGIYVHIALPLLIAMQRPNFHHEEHEEHKVLFNEKTFVQFVLIRVICSHSCHSCSAVFVFVSAVFVSAVFTDS